ncbi:MAG: hypothetical protein J6O41_03295 [Clostridia bacterium]|nr:hypothetical protein [Clostridia bacterium]
MLAFVNINSKKNGEVNRFLSKFYNNNLKLKDNNWEKKFSNPIEIAELIGVYIDNFEDYELSFWFSLDDGIIIKVDKTNANEIIKYLYERFPY